MARRRTAAISQERYCLNGGCVLLEPRLRRGLHVAYPFGLPPAPGLARGDGRMVQNRTRQTPAVRAGRWPTPPAASPRRHWPRCQMSFPWPGRSCGSGRPWRLAGPPRRDHGRGQTGLEEVDAGGRRVWEERKKNQMMLRPTAGGQEHNTSARPSKLDARHLGTVGTVGHELQ